MCAHVTHGVCVDLCFFERLQEDAAPPLRLVLAAVKWIRHLEHRLRVLLLAWRRTTDPPDLGELDAPFRSDGIQIGGCHQTHEGFGHQAQPAHEGFDACDEPGIHEDDQDQYLRK